jgi:hypothetical protein
MSESLSHERRTEQRGLLSDSRLPQNGAVDTTPE